MMFETIIGHSPAMAKLYEQINVVAKTPFPVVIQGETGTSKELVARALHQASGRTGTFVAINCAAVVDSLIESELFGHEKGHSPERPSDRSDGLNRHTTARSCSMRSVRRRLSFRPSSCES